MNNERCYYLLPRHELCIPLNDDDLGECLLQRGHTGPHLIQLINSQYLEWAFDEECTDCHPEECECFIYSFVTNEEAKERLPEKSS